MLEIVPNFSVAFLTELLKDLPKPDRIEVRVYGENIETINRLAPQDNLSISIATALVKVPTNENIIELFEFESRGYHGVQFEKAVWYINDDNLGWAVGSSITLTRTSLEITENAGYSPLTPFINKVATN